MNICGAALRNELIKMVGIRLSANMDCNHICKLAQEVINNHIKQNGTNENLMLVLRIQQVTDDASVLPQNLPFSPLSSSEPS